MLGLGNILTKGGAILGFPNKYSFNFDGSNQTLDLSDAEFPSGNSAFTISCWFNKTSSVSYAGLVSWGTATTHQANFLNFDNASHVKAGFFGNDLENGSGTATSTGVWYHAAVTYDGTTRRIYVNGSEEVNDTPSSVNVTLGGTLRIGTTVDGNYDFDGLIDEVAIWNTALSASDIAKIASKPLNLSKASSYDTDRTSNLKLWLRAGDKVLPEEDASIARSDFYTDFDGADDIINCGSDSSLDNIWDGGGTLTGWIYPNSDGEGDDGRIAEKRDDGNGWTFVVREESSGSCKLRLFINYSTTNGIYTTDADVTIGAWNHVALTYDSSGAGSSYRPTFYVNGVVSALSATTDSAGTADSDASEDLTIGGNKTPLDRCFDGGISNLTLHQTILDAQTIKQFAKSRFTPMRNNRFSVVDFDGSNDYIDCGNDSSLQITGALTISTWLNQGAISDGSETVIYSKGDQGSARGVVLSIFRLDSSGGYTGFFALSSNGTSYAIISSIAYGVLDNYIGEWIHISATYDGAGNTKIYLNGTLQDSDSTSSFTINNSSQNAFVGSDGSASRTYEGSISSLAVYNTAKSAEEIYAIYQQGITYDESSLSGLVGYWRMGDDTSKAYPTIADSSSNSNDGTITNGASDDIVQQMVAGYDLGAFESTGQELGVNLVTNSTFDSDITGWTLNTGSAGFSIDHATVGGRTCVDIHDASDSDRCNAQFDLGANAVDGALYKISYYARKPQSGNTSKDFIVGLGFSNVGGDAGNVDKTVAEYDTWEYQELYIICGTSNNYLQFLPTAYDNTHLGRLFLDDVKVQKVLQSADLSDTYPAIVDVANPTLGIEEITNGTFDTDSDWTKSSVTISGGKANFSSGGATALYQDIGSSLTGMYFISFDITDYTSGTLKVYGGVQDSYSDSHLTEFTAVGSYVEGIFLESSFNGNIIFGGGSFTGSIDNVSVKPIQGNVGTMTQMLSSNLVYSSVLPDQSFLTGVNSAYNFIDLDGSDQSISGSISRGDAITEFTFSSWTNIDSFGDYERIFSGDDGTVRAGFRSTGKFTFHPNLTIGDIDSTGSSYSTGQWYHTMVTYNKATTTLKYYRDGDLAFTKDDCSSSDMDISGLFWIGSYRGIALFLDGSVGQTAIWDRDLSSDVGSIYNLGRHGNLLDSYSDNLLGYFAMGALDASTGLSDSISTIYDRSGNSNHGTPQNADAGDLKSSPNAQPNGYAKGDTNRSTTIP
jgi:hypothetical protein